MNIKDMIKGRKLAFNSLLNLFGQTAPMLAALFCIPILIAKLGVSRFGFITIAWMVVGYFSLFDMGLGRALTQMTAKRIGSDREEEIPALIWTGLLIMSMLAAVAMGIALLITPWLAGSVIKIPENLKVEARNALYILSFSLPLVITVAGLRGILEAYQKFIIITAIRIPLGLYSFIAPVVVSFFSNDLAHIVAVLLLGRGLGWILHVRACIKTIPTLKHKVYFETSFVQPLFRFGGWMTISNIIAPIMLYMDRFIVSALISLEAVAYYTTPFEIVSKMLIVPTAIMGVMFPAFSQAIFKNKMKAIQLYKKSMLSILGILCLPVVIIITFAQPGLSLWIGDEFAANSFRIAQLLTIGVLISAMAQPSFTYIQAHGKPKITALIHVFELPLYLLYLWYLISNLGILGAALAWLIRVSISCILLTVITLRLQKT